MLPLTFIFQFPIYSSKKYKGRQLYPHMGRFSIRGKEKEREEGESKQEKVKEGIQAEERGK